MKQQPFTKLLLQWHKNENKRQMPWKGEKDPYKVWLSEVILQQTRVEQGLSYYEKFIKIYPSIQLLAAANDEDVFKLWEGLGYYTRCRNVLFTARFIANNLNGKFPSNYEDILALKGVGVYTASAIASFCFNMPYAVVDGNVFRVLSRIFGNNTPIDSIEGKREFTALAQQLLDKKNAGAYNQAIMDFGATVCKPMLPLCSKCPLQNICIAYEKGIVNTLPVKEKTLVKKTRWFTYIIFEKDKKTFIHKRTAKDIWQNLYEFYLLETDDNPQWNVERVEEWCANMKIKNEGIEIVKAKSQQLTHQTIKGYFINMSLKHIPVFFKDSNMIMASFDAIKKFGFPKFINEYLQNRS